MASSFWALSSLLLLSVIVIANAHNHPFQASEWKNGHATHYEGHETSYGGACGYVNCKEQGYGEDTAALSDQLWLEGAACGACYEIKCTSPEWCKKDRESIIVTATNHCPPNPSLPADNGGWCNRPREHFDMSVAAFTKIAEYKAGIIPVAFRRVPCRKEGGLKLKITGNPYFYEVHVWNIAGAGDVSSVEVKAGDHGHWICLKRMWGQRWTTGEKLQGECLTFKFETSDKQVVIIDNMLPKDWQFDQVYCGGKNFL